MILLKKLARFVPLGVVVSLSTSISVNAMVDAQDVAMGVINAPNINIRAGDSTGTEVLIIAEEGDAFPVLARVGDWYRIKLDSRYAYIFSDFLDVQLPQDEDIPEDMSALLASFWDSPYSQDQPQAAQTSEALMPEVLLPSFDNFSFGIIDTEAPDVLDKIAAPRPSAFAVIDSPMGLNLRVRSTVDSDSLTILYPMQTLNVYSIVEDWARVSTLDGRFLGYVNTEFITLRQGDRQTPPALDQEKAEEIISFARQFIGTPYLFGGADLTSGVDCSGFVFSVMGEFGIQLGRSSRDMFNNGIPIDREEIKPGDLIFFSANGSVVTHVALYMGDGQFIHSTDTLGLGVSFASLTSDHSQQTYFGARRVVKLNNQ